MRESPRDRRLRSFAARVGQDSGRSAPCVQPNTPDGHHRENVRSARDVLPRSVQVSVAIDRFPPIPLDGVFYSAGDPTSGHVCTCLAKGRVDQGRWTVKYVNAVVFGQIWISVAGVKCFSSMFIEGRPEISTSNFAQLRVKGHAAHPDEIRGWRGYGARRAVGVDTSTLAAAAGVEVVSFLTSSAACSPTRTTWPEAPQK